MREIEIKVAIQIGPYVFKPTTLAEINWVDAENEMDEDEYITLSPDDVRDAITQFGLGLGELVWYHMSVSDGEDPMEGFAYIAWIPSKKVALMWYESNLATPGGIPADNILRAFAGCITHEINEQVETMEVEFEESNLSALDLA